MPHNFYTHLRKKKPANYGSFRNQTKGEVEREGSHRHLGKVNITNRGGNGAGYGKVMGISITNRHQKNSQGTGKIKTDWALRLRQREGKNRERLR
jgi:hypothetical protein